MTFDPEIQKKLRSSCEGRDLSDLVDLKVNDEINTNSISYEAFKRSKTNSICVTNPNNPMQELNSGQLTSHFGSRLGIISILAGQLQKLPSKDFKEFIELKESDEEFKDAFIKAFSKDPTAKNPLVDISIEKLCYGLGEMNVGGKTNAQVIATASKKLNKFESNKGMAQILIAGMINAAHMATTDNKEDKAIFAEKARVYSNTMPKIEKTIKSNEKLSSILGVGIGENKKAEKEISIKIDEQEEKVKRQMDRQRKNKDSEMISPEDGSGIKMSLGL